jgi:hypothetical protein
MFCIGCGGRVPDVEGPAHAYMLASPGCWQRYGQVIANSLTQRHHVDCYAAQHPGGAEHDRRQRQSVAVHLISLCLLLEHKVQPSRGRLSETVLPRLELSEWPYLPPPETLGTMTVSDVHTSQDIDEWAAAVWDAWADHHDTVRRWAQAT